MKSEWADSVSVCRKREFLEQFLSLKQRRFAFQNNGLFFINRVFVLSPRDDIYHNQHSPLFEKCLKSVV